MANGEVDHEIVNDNEIGDKSSRGRPTDGLSDVERVRRGWEMRQQQNS